MGLRSKLLLVALSILALPWAGWQFVREMETLLRQGQEQALLASADALARSVAVRPGGLPAAGDSGFVHLLDFAPRLDGDVADWRVAAGSALAFGSPRPWMRVLAGRANERLHLWISVDDASAQRGDAHWPADLAFDRLELRLLGRGGVLSLRLANASPGELRVAGDDGLPPSVRVEGAWREREGGYELELALPQDFSVRALGLRVQDADGLGQVRVAGTLDGDGGIRPLPLHGFLGALEPVLQALAPEGMRVRVTDREGWVLARAGEVRADPSEEDILPWRRGLYRALLFRDVTAVADEPAQARRLVRAEVARAVAGSPAVAWRRDPAGARLLLSASVPLEVAGQVRGAVLVERSNSEVLLLTDQAFSRLLGVSLVAFLASGGVILLFATRLGQRIRRLRDAAERALDREGRVTPFPRTTARDEVGDLSRSFARLLDQVSAYTDYLRSLSGKLSHELNTPLAIVRSSLDNLDHEPLEPQARIVLARARDGVERMGNLVRTMSEVTRIEHAIDAAEAEDLDLRTLLQDCADAYRVLLAPRELRLELPAGPLPLRAAPDLLVQALDKLVDNARGFTPETGWVRLSAAREEHGVRITLANQGPLLPDAMRGRLFDSLVSLREKNQRAEGAAHLGFGLYVVRLVADLHRGHAEAGNLPGGGGVEFVLHLRGMPSGL
ncbi:ATP-binding protein [Arenimonas sp.]|uniref:ATP-binding protein n=1 Tax=Arenimonas sp. TaxID=1872635 RepID=UPI0035AE2355